MIYFLFALSFFLDGIVLNLWDVNSLFCPLFSMLSILLLYPCFEKKKEYFLWCTLLGFFYDIAYTNMLFFHPLFFLGMAYLTDKIFQKISIDCVNTYLLGLGWMIIYRVVMMSFFVLIGLAQFDSNLLEKSILSSVLLNSIYLFVFYFLIKKIRIKQRKQQFSLLNLKELQK